MKFWQIVTMSEPDQLVDIARIAEEVGFDGVMCSDHLFFPRTMRSKYPYSADGAPPFTADTPWPDPFVLFGAMAAVTTRLQFSIGVLILPLRGLFDVAKPVATLAQLSGGRFALGCGAGWMRDEFLAAGIPFETRGRRMGEMIVALRKLWSGQMVEHHGEFFDFDELVINPAPPAPVPVWIGGSSKAALKRTANLADGWIGAGNSADEAVELMAELRRLRAEAGRSEVPFENIVPLTTPPDVDMLRRLEEQGMTGTVSYPFAVTVGPTSTIDEKRRNMEAFAENVIRRMK